MRPVTLASLLLPTLLLGSSVCLAQGVDELGAYGGREDLSRLESDQNFAYEFRVGPYLPQVDEEFSNGATPFRDTFGDKNRILFGMEFDWEALTLPNTLSFGPGAGFGYTTMGAMAPLASGDGRSDQATSLRVLPHWLVGVLRVDALARRASIPLVFTGKLGLAEALWWARNADKPAKLEGSKGKGRSYGYYWGLGVMLDTSFLEGERARKLDSLGGINHVYLFGEYYELGLDGFGSGKVMQVGDRTWTCGFAVEM
jgi:hypothetical protein